jgi:DnaK suppressor protein
MTTWHQSPIPLRGADALDHSGLSSVQRAQLAQRLEAERDALRAAMLTRRRALAEAQPERGDEADDAAWNLDQHLALRFGDAERRLLAEVEHALAKLTRGEYGVCEGTGEPIGFARLLVRPWARHSVAYREQLERAERMALAG